MVELVVYSSCGGTLRTVIGVVFGRLVSSIFRACLFNAGANSYDP